MNELENPAIFDFSADESLQERIELIAHKLKYVQERPAVFCISRADTPISLSTYVYSLAGMAGGSTATLSDGGEGTFITPQILSMSNAELILLGSANYSIEQTLIEAGSLFEDPDWQDLQAVKNGRVYIIDGASLFTASTPAAQVESVEMLAEIIHPKYFIFGYEGSRWIKFTV